MNDRDLMLSRIRASLATNRTRLEAMAALAHAPYPTGPFVEPTADVVEQFIAELRALQGHPHRCRDADEARRAVADILAAHKAERVLHWSADHLPLAGVLDVLRECGARSADGQVLGAADRRQHLAGLDDVPVAISGVDAAIAESATMLVVSGAGRGRLASLLPPVHIALLPAERIRRTLPEAWALLRSRFGDDVGHARANTTLITGPSRTADIEQTLTLGVHGPKEVHAIIVDRP